MKPSSQFSVQHFRMYIFISLLSLVFLGDFVGSVITDKYISENGITRDSLDAIEELRQSGTGILDIGKYTTVVVLISSVFIFSALLNFIYVNLLALAGLTFIITSLVTVVFFHPDEMVRQLGSSIRMINWLFILPIIIRMTWLSTHHGPPHFRRISWFGLLLISGVIYSSCSIIFRLLTEGSLFESGVRYSVLPGFATSTASLFAAAIFVSLIITSIDELQPSKISNLLKLASLIAILSSLFMIILTGSRGPFLAFATYILSYFLLGNRKSIVTTLFAVSTIIALFFSLALNEHIADAILSYLSAREGADISTGRLEIWLNGLGTIQSSGDLLVGTDASYAAHNSIIGLLMRFGLPATIIYVFLIVLLLKKSVSFLNCSRGTQMEELSRRLLSTQIAIIVYGLIENFFYLNIGLIMMVFYVSFGIQVGLSRAFFDKKSSINLISTANRYKLKQAHPLN